MRDDSVSIAKGIAIILMVMAHARCPLWWQQYINMFHMPLFFFFSGYCFKISYLDNVRKYAIKRVKGIYFPYVKWSLLFLLCHNLFFYLNIYNGEYGFRGSVSHLYSLSDYAFHAVSILTRMTEHEQLLGGYWFMHTMFFASFIFFFTVWLCRTRYNINLLFGGGILLLLTTGFLIIGKSIPYLCIGARETLAATFMITGYWYKESKLKYENHSPWIVISISAAVIAIGTEYWQCSMLTLTWEKLIPYTISALAGVLMVFTFSKICLSNNFLRRGLVVVGEHTLEILTWHFLSFKLVSMIIIGLYDLPITQLAEFPVIESFAYQGWWSLYSFVGIIIPLYSYKLILFTKNKIHKYAI